MRKFCKKCVSIFFIVMLTICCLNIRRVEAEPEETTTDTTTTTAADATPIVQTYKCQYSDYELLGRDNHLLQSRWGPMPYLPNYTVYYFVMNGELYFLSNMPAGFFGGTLLGWFWTGFKVIEGVQMNNFGKCPVIAGTPYFDCATAEASEEFGDNVIELCNNNVSPTIISNFNDSMGVYEAVTDDSAFSVPTNYMHVALSSTKNSIFSCSWVSLEQNLNSDCGLTFGDKQTSQGFQLSEMVVKYMGASDNYQKWTNFSERPIVYVNNKGVGRREVGYITTGVIGEDATSQDYNKYQLRFIWEGEELRDLKGSSTIIGDRAKYVINNDSDIASYNEFTATMNKLANELNNNCTIENANNLNDQLTKYIDQRDALSDKIDVIVDDVSDYINGMGEYSSSDIDNCTIENGCRFVARFYGLEESSKDLRGSIKTSVKNVLANITLTSEDATKVVEDALEKCSTENPEVGEVLKDGRDNLNRVNLKIDGAYQKILESIQFDFGGEVVYKDYTNCEMILGEDLINFLNDKVFAIVKVGVPILIIVLGSVDLLQALVAQDSDKMKKAQSKFIKRLIIGVVIFFVPTIVNIALNLLNGALGVDITTCGIG
ncbi:MAG: hypothetical protein Q4G04_03350 [bacterium]|nr:hypothetical protein [bacterium]